MSAASAHGRERARVVTLTLATVALITGDAVMLGVVAVTARLLETALLQWLAATTIITCGSYILYGLPQIRIWSTVGSDRRDADDIRSRLAKRLHASGGAVAYVAASIVGGALIAGWYYGSRRLPRARTATFGAALILAAFWSSVYTGLIGLAG